jgi:hypothetical protein
MILKSYSIHCEICTRAESLQSKTVADASKEAIEMGWKKLSGMWHCDDCHYHHHREGK